MRLAADGISLESVTKYYDPQTRALSEIDLEISKGEWVSIIGPSGSGKTTLLNLMSGLDIPTSGKISIDGVDITHLNQKMLTRFRGENLGLIFQQYHLIPYLTALENVMIAQYFHGTIDREAAQIALERVGLGHRAKHRPAQLSGGEQQRVCIARALINEPNIILADEPTGNLDMKNGESVIEIIKKLNGEGHTVIVITHNMDIAKQAGRVIELVDGKVISNSPINAGAPISRETNQIAVRGT